MRKTNITRRLIDCGRLSARLVVAVVLSGCVLCTAQADGATLTINPSLDLDVTAGGTVSNDAFLDIQGINNSSQTRALLKFDLSALSAVNAIVSSATLTFNQIDLGGGDDHGNANLRRIGTSDWSLTTPAGTLFSLVSDGGSVAVTSFSLATNPPPGLKTMDVTSTVSGWLAGSFDNFGFGITATEGPFSGVARRFDSMSGTIPPSLFVTYTLPPPVVPEPSTIVLLGLGFAGVVWRRRKSGQRSVDILAMRATGEKI